MTDDAETRASASTTTGAPARGSLSPAPAGPAAEASSTAHEAIPASTPEARRFPIRIGRRSRGLVRLAFGATPETAWADVSDDAVTARFGRFTYRIPLAEIARYRIEGPFRWITAIGVRMSVRHRDISFAGSPHGGVRMDFRRPLPWGPVRLPAFYVGADDLEAFAEALRARGIPGEDARSRRVD